MLVNCNPSTATPVEDDCLTFHQDRIAVIRALSVRASWDKIAAWAFEGEPAQTITASAAQIADR